MFEKTDKVFAQSARNCLKWDCGCLKSLKLSTMLQGKDGYPVSSGVLTVEQGDPGRFCRILGREEDVRVVSRYYIRTVCTGEILSPPHGCQSVKLILIIAIYCLSIRWRRITPRWGLWWFRVARALWLFPMCRLSFILKA